MPTTSTSARQPGSVHRAFLFLLATLAMVILGAACSSGSSPAGALGQDKQTLATCDRAHAPASWVAIDGTGSSAADSILADRLKAIESIARTTAICSGYLRVIVFTSSSVATTVLFDGSLAQPGATTNARLLRVPNAVASVMDTIRKGYSPAVAGLDPRASDITAQYVNAAEWTSQLGGTYRLHLYLLTDGFQNVRLNLYGPVSPQQAEALADQTPVPNLPGASVVVAGLGRVAGSPARSDVVAGLVAYYDALCHKTGATKCVSVSDYEAASR
jgi:hypothetical protein